MRSIFDSYPIDTRGYTLEENAHHADVFFLPYRYQTIRDQEPSLLADVLNRAQAAHKKVLFDAVGDEDVTIENSAVIVLKYAGYRFQKHPNEIIIPPYADDLLERCNSGTLQSRPKAEIPLIGFAGWTQLSTKQLAVAYFKETPNMLHSFFDGRYAACTKGVLYRRKVLARLHKTQLLKLNLIKRRSYSGNVKTAEANLDMLRNDFVRNILESDLALDVRGDANASTRLFEILSLGRVPLIIDTERNFPFSDSLDYSSFSISVDFRELKKLPGIVRERYDAISNSEWYAMQQRAREAYVSYFRVDALFPRVIEEIRKRLK